MIYKTAVCVRKYLHLRVIINITEKPLLFGMHALRKRVDDLSIGIDQHSQHKCWLVRE